MALRRVVWMAAALVALVGCETFSTDLSPDELHQLAEREKIQVHFIGEKAPAPKYADKVGKVDGRICQAALLTPINEFQALAAMWASATTKKATAIVNAECGSSSFLLATGGSYCWPGYYCRGDAVK